MDKRGTDEAVGHSFGTPSIPVALTDELNKKTTLSDPSRKFYRKPSRSSQAHKHPPSDRYTTEGNPDQSPIIPGD